MINANSFSLARRLAGGGAVGVLCGAAAFAAWAAQPPRAAPFYPTASAPAAAFEVAQAVPAPARTAPLPPRTAPARAVPVRDPCLTNACAEPAPAIAGKTEAIKAAIAAGNTRDVLAAGGSAADVLASFIKADELAGRPNQDLSGRTLAERLKPGTEQFVTGPRGQLALTFDLIGGGSQTMSRRDLADFPVPPGTPDSLEIRGIARGSVPITVPGPVGADGSQPMRILGYAPPPAQTVPAP